MSMYRKWLESAVGLCFDRNNLQKWFKEISIRRKLYTDGFKLLFDPIIDLQNNHSIFMITVVLKADFFFVLYLYK